MRSSLALFITLLSALPLQAEKRPLKVDDYLNWERVSDPQISPDGKHVVYSRTCVNRLKDTWVSELWTVNIDGTRNRRLAEGNDARWSPDGTRIAYIHDGKPKGKQIFVRWMDAEGSTSQITRVLQSPAHIHWSPNGKQIAFTMLVPKKPDWNIPMPAPPKGAKWTAAPRIVENSHYRQDRRGFMKSGYQHLFVVPSDGGTARQLTKGNWHVGARTAGLDYGAGIDWMPSGEDIVFDGLKAGDADRRYRESHLYAVNVKSRKMRQITKRKGPWTSPVVSPDGNHIAFVGFDWTPQTYKAPEVHVIRSDGKNHRRVSGGLDRQLSGLHWAHDGQRIYFTVHQHGSSNVFAADSNGRVEQLTKGNHRLYLTSLSKNGVAAGLQTSYHKPPDVVTYALPQAVQVHRLTRVNDDVLADIALGEVEEITYSSTNEAKVQGWIIKPPDFNPRKKYPLILHIHGGPHGMYHVGFNFSFQHLSAGGYVVLYTNPRGSTGYGTRFGNTIDNAYPSVDYDDLMAGVDALIKRGYVDEKRMYVTGVSGGGVLSSWIIGHTNRFAAAAVRAPVTNWVSFAGTTDITIWGFYRFRTPYWDDPQLWLKHSPIMYVKNVKTPTLMMCGELDLRTPMGQTEEYYQALRARNVPTALIRFHGEYHGTGSKPSNFMRTQLYLLHWFGKHRK